MKTETLLEEIKKINNDKIYNYIEHISKDISEVKLHFLEDIVDLQKRIGNVEKNIDSINKSLISMDGKLDNIGKILCQK